MNGPKFLTYKNSRISYLRFGSGSRTAVCFHGYGESAGHFAFLEEYAGNQYTFFAIDLPFHGQTKWNEGLPFSTGDLRQIVNLILKQDSRSLVPDSELPTHGSQLSLLGFSLGGRIALSLYEQQPGLIEKLVLLAPDGLKVNAWYWLATQTRAGNKFFAFTMKHPGWFFGMLKLLNKLGMVNASIFKFVNHYIGDPEVRQLLYNRWTGLRKIKAGIPRIKAAVRKFHTPMRLIYGLHDRIILSSVGEKFRKGIEDECSLSVIHSGHQVLHEKHIAEILPLLLD